MHRLIDSGSENEWTFELIERYHEKIAAAAKHFGLTTFPNQIEIISAEQMMDAYSSVGMPIFYHHWSYGKHFMQTEKLYRRAGMGLAYEIVINSNPCISYLMEENTMTMQALVIAHAAYGHNSFFKNNYLFKTWTNPDAIVDYLVFARNFIRECEEKHGEEEVELFLDSCHALMNYGVDRYKRPSKLSAEKEKNRQKEREEYLQMTVNDLWRTLPTRAAAKAESKEKPFPLEPQENLLYFIEKNAPLLEPWQREIIRIVRKIAQYFYPQRQTQVMNEGWASFWHYTLINHLYDEGYLSNGFMMEFLQSHTNVLYQPGFDSPHYSGLNPYALGFGIFSDIRRMCEHPTDEDRLWFPDIAGSDWIKATDFAMRNFKDESFIAQYLSPKVIRDLKLFQAIDDDQKEKFEIGAIHDEAGYRALRTALSDQKNLGKNDPNIQVYKVDRGDRSLSLIHVEQDRRPLYKGEDDSNDGFPEVLKHHARLWGFTVRMIVRDEKGGEKIVGECKGPLDHLD